MDVDARATAAVRQIELCYKQFIDSFVQDGRTQVSGLPGRPGPLNAEVLAYAHEQAWRHGIVKAQRTTNPQEWALLTVTHEAAAYEHLLGWAAAKYRVSEADVAAAQSSRGYRHFPR